MTTTLAPPRPAASAVRLCPGYHLVPADDSYLLYRPDGQFARLHAPPSHLDALAARLAGEQPASGAADVDPDAVEALLEAFCREGVAERISTEPERPVARRVSIDGEGPIAEVLVERLTAGGLEVDRSDVVSTVPPDVVVTCSGWMSDALLQERDAWCVEHRVAWHGVYAEGRRFHLGPFWLPDDPRTVRYADARARRLAADVHPEGLEAYWRYLDSGVRVPPLDPPSAAEAALVAGALAADLLAWAAGSRPPSHGHQLALGRTTCRWHHHPVLPVPRGLMTEAVD